MVNSDIHATLNKVCEFDKIIRWQVVIYQEDVELPVLMDFVGIISFGT